MKAFLRGASRAQEVELPPLRRQAQSSRARTRHFVPWSTVFVVGTGPAPSAVGGRTDRDAGLSGRGLQQRTLPPPRIDDRQATEWTPVGQRVGATSVLQRTCGPVGTGAGPQASVDACACAAAGRHATLRAACARASPCGCTVPSDRPARSWHRRAPGTRLPAHGHCVGLRLFVTTPRSALSRQRSATSRFNRACSSSK